MLSKYSFRPSPLPQLVLFPSRVLLPLRIEAEQQLLKNGVELGDRWEADNKALTTELGQATLDRVGKLYQQNKGFMNIRIRFK